MSLVFIYYFVINTASWQKKTDATFHNTPAESLCVCERVRRDHADTGRANAPWSLYTLTQRICSFFFN